MMYLVEYEGRDGSYDSVLVRGVERFAGVHAIPPEIIRWATEDWIRRKPRGAGRITFSVHRVTVVAPDADTGWAISEVGGDVVVSRFDWKPIQ